MPETQIHSAQPPAPSSFVTYGDLMSEIEYMRLARKFQNQHRVILRNLEIAVMRNATAKRRRSWPCDDDVKRAIEAHRALLKLMLEQGDALLN